MTMEHRDTKRAALETGLSESLEQFSGKLRGIRDFLNHKYYEVDTFVECILLSMISRTNMIALGPPGIAKSAILREIVNVIDFDVFEGTPYFHIQMGTDISPNNILGAPDIEYYKRHGIIKRAYQGFLPDAAIAFFSEFYRISDQVANSGILTILNEGEFKNGTDTVKTNLRFFMADTNFFPKQPDDLDADETDYRLQALHDRFLSRVLVSPLQDDDNKVRMILMDDHDSTDLKLSLNDLIWIQDHLELVELPEAIARAMVEISNTLTKKHKLFISPRRLKMSRNLIRASALLSGRLTCRMEDLMALQFSFWQKEEDIQKARDLILDTIGIPESDGRKFDKMALSILQELQSNIDNTHNLPTFNPEKLYRQAVNDLTKLLEMILKKYPVPEEHAAVEKAFRQVEAEIRKLQLEA
ncbi:AAA family ATPase [Acidaminobacter sp.]|uniref:AAA family ATPase n=1 Tax=Acidaminobacter sp. TaxID=1872102 RepID=UPI00137F2DDD|nr:AAA family ATPase [Acidaminobacter sp.]MDK9711027.1 AAA family ATPase [Acidaminobacter sp.]MZQ98512.1 AAA domain-containing protein [Acidaminobacter sp.]